MPDERKWEANEKNKDITGELNILAVSLCSYVYPFCWNQFTR